MEREERERVRERERERENMVVDSKTGNTTCLVGHCTTNIEADNT